MRDVKQTITKFHALKIKVAMLKTSVRPLKTNGKEMNKIGVHLVEQNFIFMIRKFLASKKELSKTCFLLTSLLYHTSEGIFP